MSAALPDVFLSQLSTYCRGLLDKDLVDKGLPQLERLMSSTRPVDVEGMATAVRQVFALLRQFYKAANEPQRGEEGAVSLHSWGKLPMLRLLLMRCLLPCALCCCQAAKSSSIHV